MICSICGKEEAESVQFLKDDKVAYPVGPRCRLPLRVAQLKPLRKEIRNGWRCN